VKKHFAFIIKLVLTVLILVILFYQIDFKHMLATIQQADWKLLIVCILFYGFSQFLNTYKWSILLHSHGAVHPFSRLLTYNFIGMFFNFFMPGMVGGDVQKCYAVYRDEKKEFGDSLQKGRLTQIISSIMMARVTGVLAMIWHANFAYFFIFRHMQIATQTHDVFLQNYLPKILLLLLLGTFMVIIVPLFFNFQTDVHKEKKSLLEKIVHPFLHMAMVMKGYIQNTRMFLYILVLSVIFQGLMNILNAMIGMALHLNVPLSYYFIAVPLITLCTAIPISLSGFGVREGSYAYFLHFVGITTAQSVLLSLTSVVVTAVNSAIGGFLLIKEGFFIEKQTPQEEVENGTGPH
jgi:uncharacterized protein (TIRG00374 family)